MPATTASLRPDCLTVVLPSFSLSSPFERTLLSLPMLGSLSLHPRGPCCLACVQVAGQVSTTFVHIAAA